MLHITSPSIENKAIDQAKEILKNESYNSLFLLPDAHYCKGLAPVGTALSYIDKFDPQIVSADIGCGVAVFRLHSIELRNIPLLNDWIKSRFILTGLEYKHQERAANLLYDTHCDLFSREEIKKIYLESYGTLGGGNHFIELSEYYNPKTENTEYYLVIHSGSRSLGGEILKKLRKIATEEYKILKKKLVKQTVEELKSLGNTKGISEAIKEINLNEASTIKDLEFKYYKELHDFGCWFARRNRLHIAQMVAEMLSSPLTWISDTFHNYVDYSNKVVHKGSIGVKVSDIVAIPLNMRDGTILGKVKPSVDQWGYNLPHGAGRVKSRKEALETITEGDYLEETRSIITNGVHIDESPSVYKDSNYILKLLEDKLDNIKILKPIYSYKE